MRFNGLTNTDLIDLLIDWARVQREFEIVVNGMYYHTEPPQPLAPEEVAHKELLRESIYSIRAELNRRMYRPEKGRTNKKRVRDY